MFNSTERAKNICAMLTPHTTSSLNVDLIAAALQQARVYGRNEVYDNQDSTVPRTPAATTGASPEKGEWLPAEDSNHAVLCEPVGEATPGVDPALHKKP